MYLHDPLPARAFLTDFLRTPGKTPAEIAGVRLAVEKMLADQTASMPVRSPVKVHSVTTNGVVF